MMSQSNSDQTQAKCILRILKRPYMTYILCRKALNWPGYLWYSQNVHVHGVDTELLRYFIELPQCEVEKERHKAYMARSNSCQNRCTMQWLKFMTFWGETIIHVISKRLVRFTALIHLQCSLYSRFMWIFLWFRKPNIGLRDLLLSYIEQSALLFDSFQSLSLNQFGRFFRQLLFSLSCSLPHAVSCCLPFSHSLVLAAFLFNISLTVCEISL